MQIPSDEAIPQWIRDIVAVAPDVYEPPTESASASAHLKGLTEACTTPVIASIMADMSIEIHQKQEAVFNAELVSPSDIYSQQQAIGEVRGLRRLFALLTAVREELVKNAQV